MGLSRGTQSTLQRQSSCYGAVPWDPKHPAKAKQALSKFKHSSLWKIKCPILEKKAKSEYMGCPMKIQIILDSP